MASLNKLAIATHKGGVGKTTTSINLAHGIAMEGQRVLVVDLDPQAHASRSLGIEVEYSAPSVADLFTRRGRPDVQDLIQPNIRAGLDVLPASIRLAAAAENAVTIIRRENLLREALTAVERDYDLIVIDTAPGLGVLMANAIEAADRIIIPVDSGARSVDGLGDFLDLVYDLRGTTFKRWRILRTMVNKSATKTERQLLERIEKYDKRLLASRIHKSEIANQSQYSTETVFEYRKSSSVAQDYRSLCSEVREIIN